MNDTPYNNWFELSNDAILKKIGDYIQHNRIKQNKSQTDISRAAGISRSTLSLLERGEKVTLITLIQVLRALDCFHALNSFEIPNEISPIEYAKLQKKKRTRASKSKNNNDNKDNLGW